MFQHVDEKDGLEPVARELRGFALLEVAGAQREARVAAHRFLNARHAIGIGFDPDHHLGDIDQAARHRANPRPDLEHPRAQERTNQAKDVVRISPSLLHRLQVIGGVAVLSLAVSAVGV